MKKILMLAMLVGGVALAQAVTPTPPSTNPNDISKFKDIAEAKSLPTIQTVAASRQQAEALFNNGKCQEAVPALETWATQANWLSNLIASSLEPYYSASYDDRKKISYNTLDALIPFEKQSNQFKSDRNLATVMRAECLAKLGRNNEAVAVFARALDLISIDEGVLWKRAAQGLNALIGQSGPALP